MRRGRKAGGRRGACVRWGIDLFIEEGAYTTVTSAVAMLMVLTLVFSSATAVWSMSRAGDVQASADATALAGSNVVASYHTAATIIDACVLSLGLAGFAMTGVGMVGLLVPGARAAASKTVEAGLRTIEKRNAFARSASKGLNALEKSLPYLVAANSLRTCRAQSTERVAYTGVALAVPRTSASSFPALSGEGVRTEGLAESSGELEEVAVQLEEASRKTAEAKKRAWLADCGSAGRNMQERAGRLSGITAAENPDYASSISWHPQVGLERARAYYRWRRDHDEAEGTSDERQADAAARRAFFRFAYDEMARAHIEERDGRVTATVPLLPRNTDEVRDTALYTEAVWPTTQEEDGLTLHYGLECSGATGEAGPLVALSAQESGSVRECPSCRFSVGDVGKTPAASTSIDNGFEYHLRAFTLALDDYVDARNRELELERQAKKQAEGAGDAFEEAISVLKNKRPRIAPPGRDGCVAVVAAGDLDRPESLESPFAAGACVGSRGAIAASVLAPDPATKKNNVLATFFSSLEDRTGPGGAVGLIDSVMDVWGDLLVSYGDVHGGLGKVADELLGGLRTIGMGPIADWLADRIDGAVSDLGLEPVDLSLRKPVLTDSAKVIARSDVGEIGKVQERLRSIPLGTTDPAAVMQALQYEVGEYIDSMEFTVAEIPLPGGGSIPLTVKVRDVAGMIGGEDP